jgi:hypothetical protein
MERNGTILPLPLLLKTALPLKKYRRMYLHRLNLLLTPIPMAVTSKPVKSKIKSENYRKSNSEMKYHLPQILIQIFTDTIYFVKRPHTFVSVPCPNKVTCVSEYAVTNAISDCENALLHQALTDRLFCMMGCHFQ